MVKYDLSRNYYADLEVPPGADIATIRKQFRKLALQWHPDRNPGREAEVNAKFQLIQSAQEILTDPDERAKYDAARARSMPRSFRPTSTASSTYAQPRPNPFASARTNYPPPPRPPPAQNPQPSAGARRWSKFESRYAPRPTEEGFEARAENYKAWERMRPKASSTRSPRGAARPPTAKEAYGSGSFSNRAPPVPNRPDFGETKAKPSSDGEARGHGGGPWPPQKKGFKPSNPLGDEPAAPTSAYSTNGPRSSVPRFWDPDPEEDVGGSDKPSPLDDFEEKLSFKTRVSTPYATHGGERTNPFESAGVNRSKSTREGPSRFKTADNGGFSTGSTDRHRSASPLNRRRDGEYFSRSPNQASPSSSSPKRTRPPVPPARPQAQASYRDDDSDSSSSEDETVYPRIFAKPRLSKRQQTSAPPQSKPNGTTPSSQEKNSPSIFSFKVDADYTQPRQPRSMDSIHTSFSSEHWDGKFQAGNFISTENASNNMRSPRKPRGRSPIKSRPPTATPVPDGGQAQFTTDGPTGSPAEKFFADHWSELDKNMFAFATPSRVSKSAYPSRASGRNSRSTARKVQDKTARVESEGSSDDTQVPAAGLTPNTHSRPVPTASPNAMDIDSPATSTPSKTPEEPRNVTVEPSRPEWRAGNVEMPPSQTKNDGPIANGVQETSSLPAKDELNTDFKDFKNIEPLFMAPKGLDSFKDLSSNLPFASQSSGAVPDVDKSRENDDELSLPQPPKAPASPLFTAPSQLPSEAGWSQYLVTFKAYMSEWDVFNSKLIAHFASRKQQVDAMALGWLEAKGNEGINTYRKGLRQDVKVREWWSVACERHAKAIEEFCAVREVMKSRLAN